MKKQIAIIGGGAAGIFSAAHLLSLLPNATITVFEKSNKVLEKVRISGGGRCNVTHHCFENKILATHYPRGEKLLKSLFKNFSVRDTVNWFETAGVNLKVEPDGRMFPASNQSETIITALLKACDSKRFLLKMRTAITAIHSCDDGKIRLQNGAKEQIFDAVIVTTGGSPNKKGLLWLHQIGHQISTPVPSLFTFNFATPKTELMGVIAKQVQVRIHGFGYKSVGPLLFTHWGISGPAVLRLSAFAARFLAEQDYQYEVHINWLKGANDTEVRSLILNQGDVKLKNMTFEDLPKRLWRYLLERAEINQEQSWQQTPKKNKNRLVNLLMDDKYSARGKTTFKEEFVTAGGISLQSVHAQTLESKAVPNLYFAGEVLDIDGVTGGFNFQAAWTTAYTVARAISEAR